MTAETAKQIGLISEVLEDDALMEKALWLAESIAATSHSSASKFASNMGCQ